MLDVSDLLVPISRSTKAINPQWEILNLVFANQRHRRKS